MTTKKASINFQSLLYRQQRPEECYYVWLNQNFALGGSWFNKEQYFFVSLFQMLEYYIKHKIRLTCQSHPTNNKIAAHFDQIEETV